MSLRLAWSATAIVLVALILAPVQWLAVKLRLKPAHTLPVLFHRAALWALGLRVHESGRRPTGGAALILSNHSSWIDICIIGSLLPVVFVAKAEVGTWPVFGSLARLQRTLFVDRTRRSRTAEAVQAMAERIADGDPVVMFAEGTTSDGNRVLPFKTALIGAARDAMARAGDSVTIHPLAITYTHQHGIPLGREGRPFVAWHGDMALMPHLGRLLREGGLDVQVEWGQPIAFGPDTDRKAACRAAEQQVRRTVTNALRGRTD